MSPSIPSPFASTSPMSRSAWSGNLGEEHCCFIEGCQRDWDRLSLRDGPLTVGIDGGFIRAPRKQGSF
jgi:hypothetical protein